MKNHKKFMQDNKDLLIYGLAIVAIGALIIIANNSEFIKGAKELVVAQTEGRLTVDF